MQIVIDIPKHTYEWVTTDKRAYSILNTGHMVIIDAIKNATPLGEACKDINAPTTDCISRAEAQTEIMASNKLQSEGDEVFIKVSDAVQLLRELPSVTPQPKIGQWIYDKTIENWRCSECNETPKIMGYVGTADFMAEHFRFCNHCGAKMVEPQESEDKE